MKRTTTIVAALTRLTLAFSLALLPLAGSAQAGTVDIPRTGQAVCYDGAAKVIACAGTGQDGDKQAGNPWPVPRFTDNNDGTVKDNLTGLIWLKNANCATFNVANPGRPLAIDKGLTAIAGLANGACGLSDSSKAGDWRMPNFNELRSLVDYSRSNPALPAGHPFYGVTMRADWGLNNESAVVSTGSGYLCSTVTPLNGYELGISFYGGFADSTTTG